MIFRISTAASALRGKTADAQTWRHNLRSPASYPERMNPYGQWWRNDDPTVHFADFSSGCLLGGAIAQFVEEQVGLVVPSTGAGLLSPIHHLNRALGLFQLLSPHSCGTAFRHRRLHSLPKDCTGFGLREPVAPMDRTCRQWRAITRRNLAQRP